MNKHLKTSAFVVVACALAAAAAAGKKNTAAPAAGDAQPAAAKEKKAAKAMKGAVVKVDGDKLVITAGKKAEAKEATIATGANTKVTIEGKEAKLADLKAGQQVTVTPAEGTAQTIEVAAPKAKKEKAAK